MKLKYPFDPNIKHHIIITIGFAIWTFVFLFFTEPLDISVFNLEEKLIFLPLYSITVAIVYLLVLPFQYFIYKKTKNWFLKNEVLFFSIFLIVNLIIIRILFILINNEGQNNYSLLAFIQLFYIPAVLTLFPIIILSRWSFGRYFEKKLENQKIEIKGTGNYEGLRLFFNDLIYIQASDNYIEVSYLESEKIKKALIRTKLSIIKDTFPDLLQTHRSYLINAFHFKQYKMENGKSFLSLKDDVIIPVSKTYLENVKTELNLTTK